MILSMKFRLIVLHYVHEKDNFQVSTRTRRFQNLQRLQMNLVFLWHPEAGFRLVFFRKIFLILHLINLQVSSLWQVFVVSFLAGKQRKKF